MQTFKNISLLVLIIAYVILGINHFVHPDGYLRIIPAYLPFHYLLNYLAGFFEVVFGLMLIHPKTRTLAAWGIVLMLVAFLPVHIDMLIHAPLKVGNIIVTTFVAWLRLLGQPLLIAWAWWHTKNKFKYSY